MKINSLTIENFKLIKEKTTFYFKNMNFLVGENNTGKTTLIEALDYLFNGPEDGKKYDSYSALDEESPIVEVVIEGVPLSINSNNNSIQYFTDQNEIKIKRSKSKLYIWNKNKNDFEMNNNNFFENTIKNNFNIICIYAKDQPKDSLSSAPRKPLGSLIKNYVGDFFDSEEYKNLENKFNEIFNHNDKGLSQKLNTLSDHISKILKNQWGNIPIKLKFDNLDKTTLLKNGILITNENNIEENIENKGSGLQRAVALAVIQTLPLKLRDPNSALMFCIDEPELNLHPKAQETLSKDLKNISEQQQIVIVTHSPFMLKHFDSEKDRMYLFTKEENFKAEKNDELKIMNYGPTFSEIIYKAYNLITPELHNELYGYIESNANDYTNNLSQKLDIFDKIKSYKKKDRIGNQSEKKISLQEYIRHQIHHPENDCDNPPYTEDELKQSVEEMIESIKSTN